MFIVRILYYSVYSVKLSQCTMCILYLYDIGQCCILCTYVYHCCILCACIVYQCCILCAKDVYILAFCLQPMYISIVLYVCVVNICILCMFSIYQCSILYVYITSMYTSVVFSMQKVIPSLLQ